MRSGTENVLDEMMQITNEQTVNHPLFTRTVR